MADGRSRFSEAIARRTCRRWCGGRGCSGMLRCLGWSVGYWGSDGGRCGCGGGSRVAAAWVVVMTFEGWARRRCVRNVGRWARLNSWNQNVEVADAAGKCRELDDATSNRVAEAG